MLKLPHITRISVIAYPEGLITEQRELTDVVLSIQDDGKTLKIFSRKAIVVDTRTEVK